MSSKLLTDLVQPIDQLAEPSIASHVEREHQPRQRNGGRPGELFLQRTAANDPLAAVNAGKKLPTKYTMPIAVWQFGRDLTLVGLSGEVVAEFVPLVQKTIGDNRLWIAGYCNDVFGYLVTADMLRKGGYETRGLFHEIGAIAPEAQDTVLRAVRDLARKAGRPDIIGANTGR